jgi:hypothetical protein
MALTEIPIELSSTPSIVDGGNATAITISSAELVTVANGLTLTDGNVVVAAGHGIDFSAQTATSASGSSATAELFDHYEEGSWTPAQAGVTLTVVRARSVRVGNLVTATCRLTWPSNSDSTAVYITGLPFACTGTWESSGSVMHQSADTGANTGFVAYKSITAAAVNVFSVKDDAAWAVPTNAQFSGAEIILTITYQTP